MKYYQKSVEETLKILNTDVKGLSESEAKIRLENDGKNKITETKKISKFNKFINQFNNLMIIILLIAALVSFILSKLNNESFIDSIIIIAIIIINAILGYIQESKADKAIEALKKMQITNVKVKRDNKIMVINSEDIVKGDILILEAGDTVPADARVIWEVQLKVDESSLTGESIPVSKVTEKLPSSTPLSERKNMIYSGTSILYGKCHAVTCETGMSTELGLIAESLNKEEKEITPLQKKINGISKFLTIIIAIVILIMFIIGIVKKMELLEVIMLSISLAVAAIPEGLPAIITITLSLGMGIMAKKKAIVRKIASVETLGCTEIICSDKTGTITQNKMKVRELYFDNTLYNENELKKENLLLKIMVLNNDVEKTNDKYIGDPTEIALYEYSEKYCDITKLREENERIEELPFDSNRKMMSTINKNNENIKIYTKGSFDAIINHCSYIFENNKIYKLNEKKKNELKEIEKNEAQKAYRILAYAYKDLDKSHVLNSSLENGLIFVGMTAMIDPPREDVKEAIAECKKAHIKLIMITGDSLSTAISIAKEVGILKNESEAITGSELDKMKKKELKKNVLKYSVYARVSPTNKLAIVNAWKQNNKIVAMTGDGVNDAPALKAASIGIGMGITGTEVSKNVSDIILADDSFSTIVVAVKEGRRIYDNIRNVLIYLLAGNIAEILIVFIGMLFGFEIFLPIQLLYLNLITDSMPAISLAFEKANKNIMQQKIRKSTENFFTPFLIAKLMVSAILKTITVLLIYLVNLKIYNIEVATSLAFLTLILLEMSYAYNCKNLKKNVIGKNFFNNSFMNKSMLILILLNIIVFTTPLKTIFNISELSIIQIAFCIVIVTLMFMIDEFSKSITAKIFKD